MRRNICQHCEGEKCYTIVIFHINSYLSTRISFIHNYSLLNIYRLNHFILWLTRTSMIRTNSKQVLESYQRTSVVRVRQRHKNQQWLYTICIIITQSLHETLLLLFLFSQRTQLLPFHRFVRKFWNNKMIDTARAHTYTLLSCKYDKCSKLSIFRLQFIAKNYLIFYA